METSKSHPSKVLSTEDSQYTESNDAYKSFVCMFMLIRLLKAL